MELGTPPLKTNSLLEANPLTSRFRVRGAAVPVSRRRPVAAEPGAQPDGAWCWSSRHGRWAFTITITITITISITHYYYYFSFSYFFFIIIFISFYCFLLTITITITHTITHTITIIITPEVLLLLLLLTVKDSVRKFLRSDHYG